MSRKKGVRSSKNHIGETKIKKYSILTSFLLVFIVLCLAIIGAITVVFPSKYANFVEKYSKIYGVRFKIQEKDLRQQYFVIKTSLLLT